MSDPTQQYPQPQQPYGQQHIPQQQPPSPYGQQHIPQQQPPSPYGPQQPQYVPPAYGPPPAIPQPYAPTGAVVDPAKAKRRKTNAIIFGIIGGIVLVSCVIGIAANSGTKDTPAASATTHAATNVVKTDAQLVEAWYQQGGQDEITALGDDMTAISNAATPLNLSKFRSGCTALQSDVSTAQAHPVPVASVEVPYGKALTQLERAATDCLAGLDSMDPSVIQRSTNEIVKGTTYLEQTTAAVNALTP